jgi:gluconokinase
MARAEHPARLATSDHEDVPSLATSRIFLVPSPTRQAAELTSQGMHGIYVVMGVSGSGKTTIGAALARALRVDFVEGDEFHPAENVERMSRGIPLTDDDRVVWLRALAERIGEATKAGTGLVITCSALKRSYRDILRAGAAAGGEEPRFIFLRGSRALIAERLACRRGHFMPASLLGSQFATLEEPSADEDAWVCDIANTPDDIVTALIARITG